MFAALPPDTRTLIIANATIFVSLYLQSLNDVIDFHGNRLADLGLRVPGVIWAVLYAITALAMTSMGYQTGLAGRRRPLAQTPFAAAFAAVMLLIADLDRPGGGWIRVSQQPMADLIESMIEPAPR